VQCDTTGAHFKRRRVVTDVTAVGGGGAASVVVRCIRRLLNVQTRRAGEKTYFFLIAVFLAECFAVVFFNVLFVLSLTETHTYS
jgi:hypothetical protein